MRRFSIFVLAAAFIAVIALQAGCYPPKKSGGPTPDVSLTVDSSCNFADDIVELNPGNLVRICNDNDCLVTIVFEDRQLFGRTSVRLSPGECVNMHVRKGAAGKTFVVDMDCESCDTGGGHGSPEFKVGGGGP